MRIKYLHYRLRGEHPLQGGAPDPDRNRRPVESKYSNSLFNFSSRVQQACLGGTPSGDLPRGDCPVPRVSPSNQEMLMSVSEDCFWYVRRALQGRSGQGRYHKTRSTKWKYKGIDAHHSC